MQSLWVKLLKQTDIFKKGERRGGVKLGKCISLKTAERSKNDCATHAISEMVEVFSNL